MNATYQLTIEDHKAFQRYYFTQTKEGQRLVRRNLVVTMSCLAAVGFAAPTVTMTEWMLAAIISGVVLAGLFGGAVLLGRGALLDHMVKRSLKTLERFGPLNCDASMTLLDEAVLVETKNVKEFIKWGAIKKVAFLPGLVALHFAEH
ncbi:MAG TPA: hypothetical protein VM223_13305, partial [Planctomycetota bacterium]|nr:hypothetical protein [Planctomycetota bacterium]